MPPSGDTLEQKRAEWMRELAYRQRNIVFPETAMNGARFWRHLAYTKYPLRPLQKVGIFVLLFMTGIPYFVALVAVAAENQLLGHQVPDEWISAAINALVFVLSQGLTIVLMFRVLVAAFRPNRTQEEFRTPGRWSSRA
jgi:hypothetical protein